MAIKGIDRVRANLKRTFRDIEETKTHAAVHALLSEIKAESDAKTPVDTSFLVNSSYLPKIYKQGNVTVGYVGYMAEYAMWVHDMPGTLKGQPRSGNRGTYWAPDGDPKFLENAGIYVDSIADRILREVYRVD